MPRAKREPQPPRIADWASKLQALVEDGHHKSYPFMKWELQELLTLLDSRMTPGERQSVDINRRIRRWRREVYRDFRRGAPVSPPTGTAILEVIRSLQDAPET